MEIRQIVVPETKPALEWIDGRVVKESPQRSHALAQGTFGSTCPSASAICSLRSVCEA